MSGVDGCGGDGSSCALVLRAAVCSDAEAADAEPFIRTSNREYRSSYIKCPLYRGTIW